MLPDAARDRLLDGAEAADRAADWPADSWRALAESGALGWAVPRAFGGTELAPAELLGGHEQVAAACLTTAFVLSQREAAVKRLLLGPQHLQERYLPAAAAGGAYLTVGLSQLTTSRQHRGPALVATPDGGGYTVTGDIPWVTGADAAAAVVAGATLADGRQLLFALPPGRPGVTVAPPMPLAALVGSRTSAVRCDDVRVTPDDVLAGPAEQVLGPVGGGGLDTSNLALGHAAAAVADLRRDAAGRPELESAAATLSAAVADARHRLHAAATAPPDADRALSLRVDCTRLALRATQAALVGAKGAGFVAPHPAQRRARQALFFLVWSCPRPVADGVLGGLVG